MAKKPSDADAAVAKVIERIDPDPADGDGDPSGDPTYEFQLDNDSVPADAHPVYVHQSDKPAYKGLGYREVRAGEDGIQFRSGLQLDEGATMAVRDHDLMICDKDRHQTRETRQRMHNTKLRQRILKGSNGGGLHVQRGGAVPFADSGRPSARS